MLILYYSEKILNIAVSIALLAMSFFVICLGVCALKQVLSQ